MIIIIKRIFDRIVATLEHYWTFKDETPVNIDKEHEDLLEALNKIRLDHGTISRRLIALMENNNLSIQQLSSRAGVRDTTIIEWQAGLVPKDFDEVERVCGVLDADFEWFLTGKKADRTA